MKLPNPLARHFELPARQKSVAMPAFPAAVIGYGLKPRTIVSEHHQNRFNSATGA
jgi:hypothetical protein